MNRWEKEKREKPFKNYSLETKVSKAIDKEKLREEIADGTLQYLQNGKKITKLPTGPMPKSISVGSIDWEWYTSAGLSDFFDGEQLSDIDDLEMSVGIIESL